MHEPRILLASASPRRRELLKLLNIPFGVLSTDINETPRSGEAASALVQRLCVEKAAAARKSAPDAIIIAADTSVELGGNIFGKPGDAGEAMEMLHALRGRAHDVWGGIAVDYPAAAPVTKLVRTRVWMREYTEREIADYVSTGDPLDKAAAYGVQNAAFHPVARVQGCFANVMGLALCHLYALLTSRRSLPPPCLECHLHPDSDCTVAAIVSNALAVPASD